MAAQTIDSLVVTLGLDPSKFTKGQQQAMESFKRTKDEALKQGKDIERAGERQAALISKVRREAMGLLALFAGASGVKNFVGNLVSGDAAMGRFARNIGVATGEASKLVKALELAGATDAMGGIAGLNQRIQAARAGQDAALLGLYRTLQADAGRGGVTIDPEATLEKQLLAISHNLQLIEQRMPGRGGFFAGQLGFGEGMSATLLQGPRKLQDLINTAVKLGAANEKQTAAAEALVTQLNILRQGIEGVSRPFMEMATGILGPLNTELQNFLERTREWTAQQHVEKIQQDIESLTGLPARKSLTWAETKREWSEWWNSGFLGKSFDDSVKGFFGGAAAATGPQPGAPFSPAGRQRGMFGGALWEPPSWAMPQPKAGAGLGASSGSTSSSTTTSTFNLNGPITITTAAKDASGLAAGLKAGLESMGQRRMLATQANGP